VCVIEGSKVKVKVTDGMDRSAWLRCVGLMLVRRLRLGRNCRSFRSRVVVAVILLNAVFIVCLYRGGRSGGVSLPPTTWLTAAQTSSVPAVIPVKDTDTPLLDRLDTVSVRRVMNVSGSRQLEECDDWTAGVPDVDMEEPQHWQLVINRVPETFVFSAFFDPRSISTVI